MLDTRLSGLHHYTEEAIFNLMSGPPASGDDVDALEEFTDDLCDCMVFMKALGRYHEIDNFLVFGYIARRLTGSVRDYYTKKLLSYESKHGKKPDVEWMRALLKLHVEWLKITNSPAVIH